MIKEKKKDGTGNPDDVGKLHLDSFKCPAVFYRQTQSGPGPSWVSLGEDSAPRYSQFPFLMQSFIPRKACPCPSFAPLGF